MLVGTSSYLNDLVCFREWLQRIEHVLQRTLYLNWWRLGERVNPAVPFLQLISTETLTAKAYFRKAIPRAHALEEALLIQLDKPQAQKDQLEKHIHELSAYLEEACTLAIKITSSRWWKIGTGLRVAMGYLRLRSTQFWRAEHEAKSILNEFQRWQSRRAFPSHPTTIPTEGSSPKLTELYDNSTFSSHITHVLLNAPLILKTALSHNEWALSHCLAHSLPTPEPMVSIIMPTYNRARIMDDAIRSVQEQTWTNWELLICDDGSEDDTQEAVHNLKEHRIRYFKLHHGGAARARNHGVAEAQGTYIAYLDTDNIWHPAYLEIMIGALERNMCHDTAYAKYIDVVMESDKTYSLHSLKALEFCFEDLCQKNFIDLNSFVHRTNVSRTLGGITPSLPSHQDWDIVLKYAFPKDPLYVDAYLTLYRRNPRWGQLTDVKGTHIESRKLLQESLKRYYDEGLPCAAADTKQRMVSIVCLDAHPDSISRTQRIAEALAYAQQFTVQLAIIPGALSETASRALEQISGVETITLTDYSLDTNSILSNHDGLINGEVLYCIPEGTESPSFTLGEPVDENTFSRSRFARETCRRDLGLAPEEQLLLAAGMDNAREEAAAWAGNLESSLRAPYRVLSIEDYPEEEHPRLLAAAELLILDNNFKNPLRNDSAKRLFAEAAAMAIPVIASPNTKLDAWARQNYLRITDLSKTNTIQSTIEEMLRAPEEMYEMGQRARNLFLRQLSFRSMRTHFDLLFERRKEHPGQLRIVEGHDKISWHISDI